jgi:hypothetical protein
MYLTIPSFLADLSNCGLQVTSNGFLFEYNSGSSKAVSFHHNQRDFPSPEK